MKFCVFVILLMNLLKFNSFCQESSIIPLTIERDRTLVTVKIGDLLIPDILLDTGFGFDGLMIYNPDYRDSLDLSRAREVKIGGAGSGEPSIASMIDSAEFQLNSINLTNQKILVLRSDTYKGFPSNGIIGYSIFGHYLTEFNYDNSTMILHHSDSIDIDPGWTKVPLYFKNNKIPWVDAAVVIKDEPPIPLSMYIDYAAGDAIVLLEKPDMKFILPEETVEMYVGRGLSGDIYGKSGRISKLIIASYELNQVKAAFAPAEVRSKQDNADAILGNASLRRFNLIFDYSKQRLYLKPNSHFKEPFN